MAHSPKQIPESLLARLWQERAARERSLRAGDGRRFRVVYPGRVGIDAGPDFRGAVIEEEGVGLVRGDVEVHVRQRDWDAHGHGKDPRYNGVILHVVARGDTGSTTLHSGSRVPVISLEPLMDMVPRPGRGPDLWPLLKPHGYWPPKSVAEVSSLLDRAGDTRFLGKSATFLALLKGEDHEQVLYATLMEALGYSQNRAPFLELAHRVPYRSLERAVLKSSPQERLWTLQQILLSTAGFLPDPLPRTAPQACEGAGKAADGHSGGGNGPSGHGPRGWGYRGNWDGAEAEGTTGEGSGAARESSAEGHPSMGSIPTSPRRGGRTERGRIGAMARERWHLFRVRPRNHPRERIIGVTHLLEPFLISSEVGLVGGFTRLLRSESTSAQDRGGHLALERTLMGMGGWGPQGARHLHRVGHRAPIGKERARDMAVNCVLPLLHASALLHGDADLALVSLEVYRRFPKLQENELTREMRWQLGGGPKSSRLAEEEALGVSRGIPGPGKAVAMAGAWDSGRADESGKLGWEAVVWNARRQQGLIHLHELVTSPAA